MNMKMNILQKLTGLFKEINYSSCLIGKTRLYSLHELPFYRPYRLGRGILYLKALGFINFTNSFTSKQKIIKILFKRCTILFK